MKHRTKWTKKVQTSYIYTQEPLWPCWSHSGLIMERQKERTQLCKIIMHKNPSLTIMFCLSVIVCIVHQLHFDAIVVWFICIHFRKLAGCTVFITGASRGIGKAIALKAARDGANVVIAAKTADPHPKLPGTIYTAAAESERSYSHTHLHTNITEMKEVQESKSHSLSHQL